MLPVIGVMVGFYIIVRMISFLTRKGDRAETLIVKIFSSLGIIITVFCMISLLAGGSK